MRWFLKTFPSLDQVELEPGAGLRHFKAVFDGLAQQWPGVAAYMRRNPNGSVNVYISALAARVATKIDALECDKPMSVRLEFLCGDRDSIRVWFPELLPDSPRTRVA